MSPLGDALIMEEKNMADTKTFYYEDDKHTIHGPYSSLKDCEVFDYVRIWELKKTSDKDSKINKITIDLSSNSLTIEGGKHASIKILDKQVGVGVQCFAPESWEAVIGTCKQACKNVTILGKPIIDGECLDEMLYMQQGN